MRNNNHMRDLNQENSINNRIESYDVSLLSLIGHSIIIALELAFLISYLLTMLYFIRQNIIINTPSQQMQSIISIVLWLISLVLIISNISKHLISIGTSGSLFSLFYAFLALPTTQLLVDMARSLNNGELSIAALIILNIFINIFFVILINYIVSKIIFLKLRFKSSITLAVLYSIAIVAIDVFYFSAK